MRAGQEYDIDVFRKFGGGCRMNIVFSDTPNKKRVPEKGEKRGDATSATSSSPTR
jgi:hypothetical protein